MNNPMDNQTTAIAIMFVLGMLGIPIGGFAEDLLWTVGDATIDATAPLCHTMSDNGTWKEQCFEIHSSYYKLKPVFLTLGAFSGLGSGYVLAKKLELI